MGARNSKRSDSHQLLTDNEKLKVSQQLSEKFGTAQIRLYKHTYNFGPDKLGEYLIMDLNRMLVYDPDSKSQENFDTIRKIKYKPQEQRYKITLDGCKCYLSETDSISHDQRGYKYVFKGVPWLKVAKTIFYIKDPLKFDPEGNPVTHGIDNMLNDELDEVANDLELLRKRKKLTLKKKRS